MYVCMYIVLFIATLCLFNMHATQQFCRTISFNMQIYCKISSEQIFTVLCNALVDGQTDM